MPTSAPPRPPAIADAGPCALDEAVLQALQQDLSAEMMPAVIGAFIAELGERMKALTEAVQIGDWRSAGRHAHALKGTAATLGAAALADAAGRIEAAGEAGDGATVRSHSERLQQQAQILSGLLSARYPQNAASSTPTPGGT